MALSTAIYTILAGNGTLAAAFGTRIYPAVIPFDVALPCIVFEVGDIQPDYNQTSDLNWDRVNITVTVFTTKYALSETYAGNVRTALSRYSATVDSEVIDTIIFEGMNPDYDPDFTIGDAATGVGVFIRTCNFTLIRTA